jgi:hypothetical protein
LNAAFGSDALPAATDGHRQFCLRFQSARFSRTGGANGLWFLLFEREGQNNAALRFRSAFTTHEGGSFSTASGYQALGNNTTGDINTADGVSALQ